MQGKKLKFKKGEAFVINKGGSTIEVELGKQKPIKEEPLNDKDQERLKQKGMIKRNKTKKRKIKL